MFSIFAQNLYFNSNNVVMCRLSCAASVTSVLVLVSITTHGYCIFNMKALNSPLSEKSSVTVSGGGLGSREAACKECYSTCLALIKHQNKTVLLGNAWACPEPRGKQSVWQSPGGSCTSLTQRRSGHQQGNLL